MIRLGILGAGIMGRRIAAAAVDTGRFAVTAVADTNFDRAAELSGAYGAIGYRTLQDLFDGARTDAVYIGLPHHLHLPACLAAARSGVHVLVDKPLCNTQDEADQICAAAVRSGKVWMVGFSYRFRSEWRRAHEAVRSGIIGEPYFVSDVVIEAYRTTPAWYWDPHAGGGTLQLQSHHAFDRIGWLLDSRPSRVACQLVLLPNGADKSAQISAEYASGAAAGISLSFGLTYDAAPRTLFVVHGESGMIHIDQTRTLHITTADGVTAEDHTADDWMRRELAEFAGAIDGTGTDYPSLTDGVGALRGALAAARAARLRSWEVLDE